MLKFKMNDGKQLVVGLVLLLFSISTLLVVVFFDNYRISSDSIPYVFLFLLIPVSIVISGGLISAAILYAKDSNTNNKE